MGSLGRAAETRLKSENKRGGQEGEAEENQVVGERVRERGTKCRESDEIEARGISTIGYETFLFFFSLNNFDRTRNRDNTTTIIRIINRNKLVASFLITIEVSIPVFDRFFPVDDSSDLFFFFSFSKSEFPKKIDRKERNPCTVSMLEKNKYVKETSIIFFFFFIQRISVSRNVTIYDL